MIIKMNEIYVSTDVETDGPIPGPHSMLSFASAAYTADKVLVDTFTANLSSCLEHAAILTQWHGGISSRKRGQPAEKIARLLKLS